MAIPMRVVMVKELPQKLSGKHGRLFLREIQDTVDINRPRIVLDCSSARELDRHALHILLCCLEEAMKHNGDVRLAALPPGASAFLEITGANRVFDTYPTVSEAVDSFHQLHSVAMSQSPPVEESERAA